MVNKPKPESFDLEDLGNLTTYSEDDLLWLREKLIMDVERIHQESAAHAVSIKKLNQERSFLQQDLAKRARSLRAVRHTLSQLQRNGVGGFEDDLEEEEPSEVVRVGSVTKARPVPVIQRSR